MCCSINRSVCLVCLKVFVNCLVKQFAISLAMVVILLLKVIDVFIVGGGALLDYLSFKSLRAGSQVFALRMLFLCVILHTMW